MKQLLIAFMMFPGQLRQLWQLTRRHRSARLRFYQPKLLLMLIALFQCGTFTVFAQSASYDQNTAYLLTGIYGNDCSGFGWQALNTTGPGPGCTATGLGSLFTNQGGEFNTAAGNYTLRFNYGGSQNVAMGHAALMLNTGCPTCPTGNFNTAVGARALVANSDGARNTAMGYRTMENNNSGSDNTAVGHQALYLSNNGTTYGLGNNDNSVYGFNSGYYLTEGSRNSGFGSKALYADNYNSNGSDNSAFGYKAMFKGNYFPAMNFIAGTMGVNYDNTAFGANTMTDLVTIASPWGDFVSHANTAVGENVMSQVGGAEFNTAVGHGLMPNLKGWKDWTWSIPWGAQNVVMGVDPLEQNTEGFQNVAIGNVLQNIQYSLYNVAVGHGLCFLVNNSPGTVNQTWLNTTVGYMHFLNPTTTCYYNSAIGYGADMIGGSWVNTTGIGVFPWITSDNMIKVGNKNLRNAETQNAWNLPSDARFKFNIREDEVRGIEFIKLLRPVNYNYDKIADAKFELPYVNDQLKEQYMAYVTSVPDDTRYTGFIAQEVEQAAKAVDFKCHGMMIPEKPHEKYAVSYSNFVMPLIKTIQQQQAVLKENDLRNEELKQKFSALRESGAIAAAAGNNQVVSGSAPEVKVESGSMIYSGKGDEKMVFLLYKLNGNVVENIEMTGTADEIKFSRILENGIYLYAIIKGGSIIKSDKILIEAKL